MFEPRFGTSAKTMHRAVQVDGWDFLMRLDDAIDDGWIFDVGGALVMNDDIVLPGPIEFSVKR